MSSFLTVHTMLTKLQSRAKYVHHACLHTLHGWDNPRTSLASPLRHRHVNFWSSLQCSYYQIKTKIESSNRIVTADLRQTLIDMQSNMDACNTTACCTIRQLEAGEDMSEEVGQRTGGGYFKMQQLGAGCSGRDWSGNFKANATLKDFKSALEEMPVAAAVVGVERKSEEGSSSVAAGSGLRVQGYSAGCSYSKGSVASTGAGVPGGEQSKEKGHADSLVKHRAKNGEGTQGAAEWVQAYFARVRRTAREMDECGTKPKEEEVLDVGLAGFHNRHSVLRTVLESDSSTTMATALPRLMKEEQSVWGQHDEVAMFVDRKSVV